MVRALCLPCMLCLAACDEPGPTVPERSVPYVHRGVPWVIDDDHRHYLVDTGTPRTFVVVASRSTMTAILERAPTRYYCGAQVS